ncbi:MAG: penicillin-binding protein 2 [Oscillospiraceae bacterium]
MNKRVVVLFFMLTLFLGVLAVRIGILSEGTYLTVSAGANTKSVEMGKTRGYIYDKDLNPLVNNEKQLVAAIKPTFNSLNLIDEIINDADKPLVIDTISKNQIAIAESKIMVNKDDVKVSSIIKRYSDCGLAPHLIGYLDSDNKGVIGLERCYNSLLESANGKLTANCFVDAKGRILEGEPIKIKSHNYNSPMGISLTLSKSIQEISQNAALEKGLDKGAIVVLDAKTSEIRAMVSTPTFNQNDVKKSLNDINSPFINRAITPFAVGSVFKVIVAAAALEKGITPDFSYCCEGKITVDSNYFNCHKKDGHGTLSLKSAMGESCNPYFVNLALQTGAKAICEMGANLGLGSQIELADDFYASGGKMPTSDSVNSNSQLSNLGFGQGDLLSSPLQMAAVYAAIANDGVYRSPSLMRAIIDKDKEELQKAELPTDRRVMSSETAKLLNEFLRYTVEFGSGSKAENKKCTAAGKTATAQSGSYNENGIEINRSWFCGYFPYQNPEYVIVVMKEDGIGGGTDCAPIFKQIADGIEDIEPH